jgi:hypothetical protein
MKRGILFVALALTAAGVASATVFTGASSTGVKPPQAAVAAPLQSRNVVVASSRQVIVPEAAAKPVPNAPAPVVHKASVETRQAPVPLQIKSRPPVVEAAAAEAKTETASLESTATTDGITESAVKAAIEADGYKGVRVLRKGANGAWFSTALRGETVVPLVVDAAGSVSAQ